MSTPGNALDIQSAGLVKFDGSTNFSAETTTQYNVLVGNTSNGITNVAPGTAGQILTSNGPSANPSFKAIPQLSTGIRLYVGTQINNVTGDGTYYDIIYDIVDYNTGAFTYNSLNGQVTTNSPGLYLITANIVLVGMDYTHIQGIGGPFVGNHGAFYTIHNPYACSCGGYWMGAGTGTMVGYTVSTVINMSTGNAFEYVKTRVNVNGGAKTVGIVAQGGANEYTFTNSLSITKLL